MKRTFFVSLLFCLSFTVVAQSQVLNQANEMYKAGNYQMAATLYEQVLAKEGIAPEVYYNLGNAYYRTNEVGRSILNYERALRLSPNYDDALFNLQLAEQRVVDNIIQTPTFFLGRWISNLIKLLSSNQWFYVSIAVFFVCLISLFLFIFGNTRGLRKSTFYVAMVLLTVTILTAVFSGVRKEQLLNHHQAIVMAPIVVAKSSPDRSGTDLFQLHEGTKVVIKSTLGSWVEIKIGNGSIGWVELKSIEKI